MTDLRSEEQRIRDEIKQALIAQEHRALMEAYYLTYTSDSGRIVLKDLERKGYLYTTILTTQHPDHPIDPIQSWANEGRRQMVIEIHAMIDEYKRGESGPPEKATTGIR